MGPSELKVQQKLEIGRGLAGEYKELKMTQWGPLWWSVGPTEGETDGWCC